MSSVYTCPRGHRWEAGDAEPATPSGTPATCPTCGQAAQPTDATPFSVAGEDTGPYVANPPSQAVLAEELRTRPPQPNHGRQTPGITASAATAPHPAWPAVPGYAVEGIEGSGGMGLVLRGHDPEFNRTLAVKVLLDRHRDNPGLIRRFLEEGQITGQLQHPGVPPVHHRGRLADGRPFFTMKLIKGRTLADLLKERTDPAQEPERFLAIFGQVCQTLAYAHSRRVIHRDLKPTNVMVGKFGEVQVMDWGLAKVLGAGESVGAGTDSLVSVHTARSEGAGDLSAAGDALGTPAFMPPEQARGDIDDLDERCDVFGLGAILCVILTGRPPYQGKSTQDILIQAQKANLGDALARLAACKADAELIDLARRCLAADKEQRPRDAEAVSRAVAAYQVGVQERLRAAELGRAAAQAKALEERKRRKVVAVLAAAVLAVVVLAGGSGWYYQQQRAELRRGGEDSLKRADELQEKERWPEARAVLREAGDRLGTTGPVDLRQRVTTAQTNLDIVNRLDAIRLRMATIVEGKLDYQSADRDYELLFQEVGLGAVGEDAPAVAARVGQSAIRSRLVAALDIWAVAAVESSRRDWVLAVARAADPDPLRDRVRSPAVWGDRERLAQVAADAQSEGLSPEMSWVLGQLLVRRGAQQDAIGVLAAGRAAHPGDFWLNFGLAGALDRKSDEPIGYYLAAVALRPAAAAVRNNLGDALRAKGRTDDAIAEFHKAIQLDPKLALPHHNLGLALHDKGRTDDAIAEYNKAIQIDPKLALPHNSLGNIFQAKGRTDDAIAEYNKAIQLDPNYAHPHNGLGNALRDKGRTDDAVAEFQKAIQLDPKFAHPHNGLGNALGDKGRTDDAIAEFQKAIQLDPKDAHPHNGLGRALHDNGRTDDAIAEFQKAIQLDPKYALPHYNLGRALRDKGRTDDAIAEYQKAIQLDPKPARPHLNLGAALRDKGRTDDAIAEFQKAIQLDPKFALPHYNLGLVAHDKGRTDDAIVEYQKAIQIDPKFAQAHCNLGHALRQKGLLTESLGALRQGHRLGSAQPDWRYPSAQWVRQAERLVEVDRKLAAFLTEKEKPADDAERLAVARFCQQPFKKLYAASCRFFAEAFTNDPKLADDIQTSDRYNAACAAALAGTGQGNDADKLDDKERARLRQQAAAWLRADLAYWTKQAAIDKPQVRQAVQGTLKHWQEDTDLAGVRDKDALEKLPAEERDAWRKLWEDVDAVHAKMQEKK